MPQEHGHETDRDSRALDGLDDSRLLGSVAAFLTHDNEFLLCQFLMMIMMINRRARAEPLAVRELLDYLDRSGVSSGGKTAVCWSALKIRASVL